MNAPRFVLLAGAAWCLAAAASMALADEPIADDAAPMTPGVHMLSFDFTFEDHTEPMRYGIYVPDNIAEAFEKDRKLGLLVGLGGRGGLGQTRDHIYSESPIGLVKSSKRYAQSVDYFIVRPLSARDAGWESSRMGAFVAEVTRRVMARYPVDPDRVHIVGMSAGGEGVWHAALADPKLYTTVVSISGRMHPQPDAVADAIKDSTVLIVAGASDGFFTLGSRAMADAFTNAGARDLLHVEVPGGTHGVYLQYFNRPEMFQWIMLHRRGADPPAGRADQTQLLTWAFLPQDDQAFEKFSRQLQKQFNRFAPYWFVENCRRTGGMGPRDELLGRKQVFVTEPFNEYLPCRLMTTAKVPADRSTTLHLEVGRLPESNWRLVVSVNGEARVDEPVTAPAEGDGPWSSFDIDLTELAGSEAFIEIRNARAGHGAAAAAWGRVELVSTDAPQP